MLSLVRENIAEIFKAKAVETPLAVKTALLTDISNIIAGKGEAGFIGRIKEGLIQDIVTKTKSPTGGLIQQILFSSLLGIIGRTPLGIRPDDMLQDTQTRGGATQEIIKDAIKQDAVNQDAIQNELSSTKTVLATKLEDNEGILDKLYKETQTHTKVLEEIATTLTGEAEFKKAQGEELKRPDEREGISADERGGILEGLEDALDVVQGRKGRGALAGILAGATGLFATLGKILPKALPIGVGVAGATVLGSDIIAGYQRGGIAGAVERGILGDTEDRTLGGRAIGALKGAAKGGLVGTFFGPIGIAIGAAIGGAVGLLAPEIKKYIVDPLSDLFKFIYKIVSEAVSKAFSSIVAFFKALPGKVASVFSVVFGVLDSIPKKIVEVAEGIKDFLMSLPDTVESFVDKFAKGFEKVWEFLEGLPVIGHLFKGIRTGATAVATVVAPVVSRVHGGVREVYQAGRGLIGTIGKGVQARYEAVRPVLERAAVQTGVDVGILTQFAGVESGFNPVAGALTSTARGLFQFTRGTWKRMVEQYGEEARRAGITDLNVYNPEANAFMAGKLMQENRERLTRAGIGQIGATELYAAHFLGAGGATRFLREREAGRGTQIAAQLFPEAASANVNIFYEGGRGGRARTVDEVYALMQRRIETFSPVNIAQAGRRQPVQVAGLQQPQNIPAVEPRDTMPLLAQGVPVQRPQPLTIQTQPEPVIPTRPRTDKTLYIDDVYIQLTNSLVFG